tara:strand:+ start:520 stop:1245 length:726 start_codon:yes stop_codon:yes gene_type:complete
MAKKHKRFIPNILTLTNMFLGFTAIGLIIQNDPVKAGTLIIIAGLLDAFDGKIARLLGIESQFGVEFDSMADTVSFCVVPAILIYTFYVEGLHPLLGSAVSFLPLMCGTIRLAKFNIDQEKGAVKNYTVGLTTPISTITLFSYLMFNVELYGNYGDPRTSIILLSLVCFLMISPIHFIKFPLLSFKSGKSNSIILLIFIACAIGAILFRGLLLLPITILFISWNVLFWLLHLNKNQAEIKN